MERSRHGALPVSGTVTPWRETWNSRPTPTNPRTPGAPGTAAGVERNRHGERSPYAADIHRGGRRGEKQARREIPVCGSHTPRRETWRKSKTRRPPRTHHSTTAAGSVEHPAGTDKSPYIEEQPLKADTGLLSADFWGSERRSPVPAAGRRPFFSQEYILPCRREASSHSAVRLSPCGAALFCCL